jgi:translation initiation factor RLI1
MAKRETETKNQSVSRGQGLIRRVRSLISGSSCEGRCGQCSCKCPLKQLAQASKR